MGRRKKCEQIKRTNNVMVRFTDAEYASISISAEQAGYILIFRIMPPPLQWHNHSLGRTVLAHAVPPPGEYLLPYHISRYIVLP